MKAEINKIHKIEITEEDFKEYENCRLSGLTNKIGRASCRERV